MRALLKSFRYAGRGVLYCLKNERNMRIHMVTAFYLLLFLPFFQLTRGQTALLLLAIAVVMAAEAVNTSIETIVNRLSPAYDQLARIAKDTAAGAVLLCAVFSVAIGFLLLWQPQAFAAAYSFFAMHPVLLAVLILSLIPAVCFIFYGFGSVKKRMEQRRRKKL